MGWTSLGQLEMNLGSEYELARTSRGSIGETPSHLLANIFQFQLHRSSRQEILVGNKDCKTDNSPYNRQHHRVISHPSYDINYTLTTKNTGSPIMVIWSYIHILFTNNHLIEQIITTYSISSATWGINRTPEGPSTRQLMRVNNGLKCLVIVWLFTMKT